ncbi:bud neck involved protein [Elasticomyces elasticus]|nr:bud neck involved protein [Elasticomyces elasticus]
MLHSRPSSADAFQNGHQSHPSSPRLSQTPRSIYTSHLGVGMAYRGVSAAPIQPYAFQSTPHLRQETRTTSAPSLPHSQSNLPGSMSNGHRQGHGNSPSTSTVSTSSSSGPSVHTGSKDDSVTSSRPSSFINLSSSVPDLSLTSLESLQKPLTPDRYRRTQQRRTDSSTSTVKFVQPQPSPTSAAPSGSGMAVVGHLYNQVAPSTRTNSSDDLQLGKPSTSESAKRYRRRSLGNFETVNDGISATVVPGYDPTRPSSKAVQRDARAATVANRPMSYHEQANSGDRLPSGRQLKSPSPDTERSAMHDRSRIATSAARQEPKLVQIPPRGVPEANKRVNAPSPLSKPTYPAGQTNQATARVASSVEQHVAPSAPSPAAQHLTALSDNDLNKGMKSRLRRAFSFGSAAELRKASAENNMSAERDRSRLRRDRGAEEMDPEQEAIARQQEAAGIGAGIYSGQGGFTGSTDNLSISSTASSASLMLRKMGKGMKKSTRSIKGLFRPKSVVGVPPADGPVHQPTSTQVSMVTVEAVRQKVNVNANAREQVGGGTGFPKLERNSIDTASAVAPEARGSNDGSVSRKSIVGSERDRAEVLAAVKKGILKRSGTNSESSSPVIRPNDENMPPAPPLDGGLEPGVPGTSHEHARAASFTTGTPDYFTSRFATRTKSMPNTPVGGVRNISFNPKTQFHDTWSSSEYDRRGEIATCNRLTPMLAQQIKEELNSFKMEMEIHELSKPHTHFF